MELRVYLRMLARSWWIVLLAGLVALNISLISSYLGTPTYEATTRFLVSPNPTQVEGTYDIVDSLNVLDKRSIIATFSEVLTSRRLVGQTMEALGFDVEAVAESYEMEAVALPDANVIDLTVRGPDAEVATVLANTLGLRSIEYINELYQVYSITILDPAVVPIEPVSPKPLRDAGIALVLGLAVGALLAVIREQLRVTIDSLQKRSHLDSMSQAYSARYFQQSLDEAVRTRPGNLSLGLVQIDILEDLMDMLPRSSFQRVLRHITQTLHTDLRGNDVVGYVDTTRFALLLPGTSIEGAALVLNRIQQSLSQPISVAVDSDQVMLHPRVSVATHEPEESSRQLTARAEQALELADNNRVEIAEPSGDITQPGV